MSKSVERFKELTMLDGASGFEGEISSYLEKNLSPYADEIKYDNLGGIYAIKKSKNPNAKTVMIAAHMDEVGFVVTKILPNGFLSKRSFSSSLNKSRCCSRNFTNSLR